MAKEIEKSITKIKRVIFCGASNLNRLVKFAKLVLERYNIHVVDLTRGGARANKFWLKFWRQEIEKLKVGLDDVLVFDILGNCSYKERGEKPKDCGEVHYNVLDVCTEEEMKKNLCNFSIVFNILSIEQRVVFFQPLLRYINQPCFEKEDHMIDWLIESTPEQIVKDVLNVEKVVEEWFKGYEKVKIIGNSYISENGGDIEKIIDFFQANLSERSPVHFNPDFYDLLSKKIESFIS